MTRNEATNAAQALAEWESALARAATIEEAQEALHAIILLRRTGEPTPLAEALHQMGHVQARQSNMPAAIDAWLEATGLLRDLPRDAPTEGPFVEILIDLGGLHCAMQNGHAAEIALLEATTLLRAEETATSRFAWALNLLAASRRLMGRNDEALMVLYEAETVARSIAHATKSSVDAASWALVLNNIGREELVAGRPEKAHGTLETCLAVTKELIAAGGSPNDLTLHAAVSNRYGHALEGIGRPAAALPFYTETVEIMRSLVGGGREDLSGDLADVEADLTRLRAALAGGLGDTRH